MITENKYTRAIPVTTMLCYCERLCFTLYLLRYGRCLNPISIIAKRLNVNVRPSERGKQIPLPCKSLGHVHQDVRWPYVTNTLAVYAHRFIYEVWMANGAVRLHGSAACTLQLTHAELQTIGMPIHFVNIFVWFVYIYAYCIITS
jgi:hypothetical protein